MKWFSSLLVLFALNTALATRPDLKNLPKIPAKDSLKSFSFNLPTIAEETSGPQGPVDALAEWEDSDAIMFSWTNSNVINEYAKRNKVLLISDKLEDQDWWNDYLTKNKVANRHNISFLPIASDSIWVRDFGPWFILDNQGQFGIVDVTYFPMWRPVDDDFPKSMGKMLGIPVYQLGVSIEGGNFYTEGMAFGLSSTAVLHQNKELTKEQIIEKFNKTLGIRTYEFYVLGESDTSVVHVDTFAKPLAPDTWVVAEFPEGSKYKAAADALAKSLSEKTSGYGTSNKIFRMKMVPKGDQDNSDEKQYRGYINSFISNRVLYFANYGGPEDEAAKKIYEKALPGYEIVGVSGTNTWWSDAIHCRSRNLLKRDTIFIKTALRAAPKDKQVIDGYAMITPSPGAIIKGFPKIFYKFNDGEWQSIEMDRFGRKLYNFELPYRPAGTRVSYYIEAEDTKGVIKRAPINAPSMTVDFTVIAH